VTYDLAGSTPTSNVTGIAEPEQAHQHRLLGRARLRLRSQTIPTVVMSAAVPSARLGYRLVERRHCCSAIGGDGVSSEGAVVLEEVGTPGRDENQGSATRWPTSERRAGPAG